MLSGRCSLHAANTATRPGSTNILVVSANARITFTFVVYIKSAPSTTFGCLIASGSFSTSDASPHVNAATANATFFGTFPPFSALLSLAFSRVKSTTPGKSVIAHATLFDPATPRTTSLVATRSVHNPVPAPNSNVVVIVIDASSFAIKRRQTSSRATYLPNNALASQTVKPVSGTGSRRVWSSSPRVPIARDPARLPHPFLSIALSNADLDAYCRTRTPCVSCASINFSLKLNVDRRHDDDDAGDDDASAALDASSRDIRRARRASAERTRRARASRSAARAHWGANRCTFSKRNRGAADIERRAVDERRRRRRRARARPDAKRSDERVPRARAAPVFRERVMTTASALREVLFGSDASYTERVERVERALASATTTEVSVTCAEWAMSVLANAGGKLGGADRASAGGKAKAKKKGGGPSGPTGTDAPSFEDVCGDGRVWRGVCDALRRLSIVDVDAEGDTGDARTTRTSEGGLGLASLSASAASQTVRAIKYAVSSGNVDDAVLAEAFERLNGDGIGGRRHHRASCEQCVDVARAALSVNRLATTEFKSYEALLKIVLFGAAAAANAQPNKPAPVGVDGEFLSDVTALWWRSGTSRELMAACEATMRAFVLHPMYIKSIPSLIHEATSAKRSKTTESGGGANRSAPVFVCDAVENIARASETLDENALRLAPWLLRSICENERDSERKTTTTTTKSNDSRDSHAVFVGLFEPLATAFVSGAAKSNGKKRSADDEALSTAIVGLLVAVNDFALYSSLDVGRMQTALENFVGDIASSVEGASGVVRVSGWSRVLGAIFKLDFRLVEPKVKTILALLLVKSRDDIDEQSNVIIDVVHSFTETRQLPDFIDTLGEVLMEASERGDETLSDALVTTSVLSALDKSAEKVPLGQSPELIKSCCSLFIRACDDVKCSDDALDKLSRVIQHVLGGCPDEPGEPLMVEAQERVNMFTEDVVDRLRSFKQLSRAKVGSILRAYVPVAALKMGLGAAADDAARDEYFCSEDVSLSELVDYLVRGNANEAQPDENAEAAAIGSAVQRIRNLARLRYPREDVGPDEAAKAGKEMKRLLSCCLRLVPDTTETSYEMCSERSEGWSVLTTTVDMWFEHASEKQIVDYYRCRLEMDADGKRALSPEEEDKFIELIVTFQPWTRAISSVLVRSAKSMAHEMHARGEKGSLCDILEDVIEECESRQTIDAACEAIKRFWRAAASTGEGNHFVGPDEKDASVSMKRMRRALEATSRIFHRAIAYVDIVPFAIALKVADCVSFADAMCHSAASITLCEHARAMAGFFATNDEQAASASCRIVCDESYQIATMHALRRLTDAQNVRGLMSVTTEELNASLTGSALAMKQSSYSSAIAVVEKFLDVELLPKAKSGQIDVGAVFAAYLAESLLRGGMTVYSEPYRDKVGWINREPEEEPELTDEQGDALTKLWDAQSRVYSQLEQALKDLSRLTSSRERNDIDVMALVASGVGNALTMSAVSFDFSEKHHRAFAPEIVQSALAVTIPALTVNDGGIESSPLAVVRFVNFLSAALDAMKQTGPTLTPEAHASFVAVVMSTYARGTQMATGRAAAPDAVLLDALENAMEELITGAGKRPLSAMYSTCIEMFKLVDADARRAQPSFESLEKTLAAPIWCLRSLVKSFGVSKAVRTATQEHAEMVMDSCARVVNVAAKTPGANGLVLKTLEIAYEFAKLGARCELSTRCVSRMCQLPSVARASTSVIDDDESSKAVFAQACELLGSLLKARREHLRRAVSNVTATCSRLLDDLRRSKASGAPDDVMRACAAKLSFVYEAAESSGLERYCTHLLADVISAITGGGIGVVAERALKPGVFALLDACGDRELQQLHAALGTGAGGARRVVLAAFIEEHKSTHKFDGRV